VFDSRTEQPSEVKNCPTDWTKFTAQ